MKVLIAGGGTGGHIFPGVAIAEAFRAIDAACEVLFVGTGNPLERRVFQDKGFRLIALSVEGMKGRGIWRQLRSLAKLPRAMLQSVKILCSFDPHIVIGVGGYASGPVALAAKIMGKRMVIQEQNSFPGITNRMLGRFADRIFISFPDTWGFFPHRKVVLTGNPVRDDLLSVKKETASHNTVSVLIVGGSQGARAINRAMKDALGLLNRRKDITFYHQTGIQDVDWMRDAYEKQGFQATVRPFFSDMAAMYRDADVVICRAGATTVAELTALGKPALFIPFPYAANNHQEYNARFVTESGGGDMLLEKDLDGKILAEKIETLLAHPERLKAMAKKALQLGRPRAAAQIVEECRQLLAA